jgi:hypothetical protein
MIAAAIALSAAPGAAAAPSLKLKPRQARGPAVEEAVARVTYRQLWVRAAPFLGAAGQPAPALKFTEGAESAVPRPGTPMWVGPDKSGRRTIFVSPGLRRLLARRGGNRSRYYPVLTLALHETAHVFQADEVIYDEALREYGASRWARAHAPSLLGPASRNPPRFKWWRDRGQFGSNYGANPLTFGWPGGRPTRSILPGGYELPDLGIDELPDEVVDPVPPLEGDPVPSPWDDLDP